MATRKSAPKPVRKRAKKPVKKAAAKAPPPRARKAAPKSRAGELRAVARRTVAQVQATTAATIERVQKEWGKLDPKAKAAVVASGVAAVAAAVAAPLVRKRKR